MDEMDSGEQPAAQAASGFSSEAEVAMAAAAAEDLDSAAQGRGTEQLIVTVVLIPLLIVALISLSFSVFYSMQIKRQADYMYDAVAFNANFERFNFNMQNILLDISPASISQAAEYFNDLSSRLDTMRTEVYFPRLNELIGIADAYISISRDVHLMHYSLLEIIAANAELPNFAAEGESGQGGVATQVYVAIFKPREAMTNIISELHDLQQFGRLFMEQCRRDGERAMAAQCSGYNLQLQRINDLEAQAILLSDRLNMTHERLIGRLLELNTAFQHLKASSASDSEQVLRSISSIPWLIAILNLVFIGVAFGYFVFFHRVFVVPVREISEYINSRLEFSTDGQHPVMELGYTMVREINEIIRLVKFTLSENTISKQENLKLRKEYHKVFKMSSQDALTGAFNRRSLDDFARHAQQLPAHFAVMMVDIDFFKKLNDNYGHQVGDQVLRKVSRTLESSLKGTDRLYRYGGEEFCITLFDVTHANVGSIAERLNNAVRTMIVEELGSKPAVTVSIGVSPVTEELDVENNVYDYIARADEALYAAKHAGRNCYVLAETLKEQDKLTEI